MNWEDIIKEKRKQVKLPRSPDDKEVKGLRDLKVLLEKAVKITEDIEYKTMKGHLEMFGLNPVRQRLKHITEIDPAGFNTVMTYEEALRNAK